MAHWKANCARLRPWLLLFDNTYVILSCPNRTLRGGQMVTIAAVVAITIGVIFDGIALASLGGSIWYKDFGMFGVGIFMGVVGTVILIIGFGCWENRHKPIYFDPDDFF